MRATRVVLAGLLTTAAILAPVSSASAHWFHNRHHGLIGGLFGFAGGVVVGAATIATAPFAIVANAASGPDRGYDGPPRYRRDGYDDSSQSYYGGEDRDYPPAYNRSSRDDRAYGPPPGPDQDEAYGPPRYSREDQDRRFNREGPPPDDYASRGDGADDDRDGSSYGRPYYRGEDERGYRDRDNQDSGNGYGRSSRGDDQGDQSDDPSD